jgi:hypothetical protein
VWFDDAGLLRQESTQLGGSSVSGDVMMTVESYGNPVQIERPAADEVLSLQAFQSLAPSAGGLSASVPS